jgi:cation:H+ antiporter
MTLIFFLLGLIALVAGAELLVLGANWLVDSAVAIAKSMGVSDLVIALTIVAAGRSMPEVATSITAAIIVRWAGGVFLIYYVAYIAYLILVTQQHDALGDYSAVMLSFVIPITIVALLVVFLRSSKQQLQP